MKVTMFKRIVLLVSMLVITSSAYCQNEQVTLQWPVATRFSKPWTRWWWMGNAVDTTGLHYNLEALHKAGLGGVELSLIYGTKGYENKFIDFLSPKWMKMYSYTVKEAHKLGMGVDLTGGTGWPFGGPNVTIQNSASRAIFQKYSLPAGKALQNPIIVNRLREREVAPLQVLMAYSEGRKKLNLTKYVQSDGHLDWTAPTGSGNWNLIAVFDGKTLQKVKRAAPGGTGWVMDPFSSTAVHHYFKRFTHAFKSSGSPAPHAFFCDSYEVFGADWSPEFFKEFQKLRGYNLEDYLPELLGSGNQDTVDRVRQDYRSTLSELLLNNFVKPWNQWSHNMGSLTRYQAHGSPGNLLNLYGAADIPETETFGKTHINIPQLQADTVWMHRGYVDPLMMKFASSAAHISGKKYASSETFTWMIEHFRARLSVAKPILDQVFLSGINHVFYQGTPYSPKGAPWPGWQFYASVDFSPYNTFWKDIPAFDKYISRSQSFLQAGKPDNDFLVYWPVQDIWYSLKKPLAYMFATGNINQWLQPTPFYSVVKTMTDDGYTMDYVSDSYLQRTKVENKTLKTPGASYKALVIPPTHFMPLKTFKAILALVKNGGKVIFVGHLPNDVPGLHDLEARRKDLAALIKTIPVMSPFQSVREKSVGKGLLITGNNISRELKLSGIPEENMASQGLEFERRKLSDGYAYFIANNQATSEVNNWISLAVPAKSVAIFNPYNGKSGVAKIRHSDNGTAVYVQLKPDQSLILRTYSNMQINGPVWSYYKTAGNPVTLNKKWNFTFEQGWPKIAGRFKMNQLQSWTNLDQKAKSFAGTGKYTTTFTLPHTNADNWLLSLGVVDASARVWVNGHFAGILWGIPFETQIGKYLKKGRNQLTIEVTNTAANRIADYDRKGIKWKKFYDINVVNMRYKPFDAANWKTVPSGLLGPVELTPLRKVSF